MARTPKARALGAALRRTREDQNILLVDLAKSLRRSPGVISRWETGDRTPKPEVVSQILTKLDVTGELYDEIMTLAFDTDKSQWVATTLPEQRQQMTAYLDWEQNATQIVEMSPLLVPGVLQTREYVQAIMTGGGVPTGEIASRVTTRLGRADVLTRERQPANLLVLLGMTALNQNIGGREGMIEQVRHLLRMAARPNVELRIVPDGIGWHPGLEGAFALITSDRTAANYGDGRRRSGTDIETITLLETRRSMLMLHQPGDVDAYRRAADRVREIALAPEVSANYLAELAKRMEKTK